MTIYPDRAAPFTCRICEVEAPSKWENRDRMTVAPICYRCERDYGGGSGLAAAMDDRLARQINALAQAISGLAWRQTDKWRHLYG
jgi:hypothetical protein